MRCGVTHVHYASITRMMPYCQSRIQTSYPCITSTEITFGCPLVAGRDLNTVFLPLPQCTTSTWAAECQASTTARMRLAPASRRCICLMTAREEPSTSRSHRRRTPPTSIPTSTTQTTHPLRMRPPSTQTACSTSTSVGGTAGAACRMQEKRCSSLTPNWEQYYKKVDTNCWNY